MGFESGSFDKKLSRRDFLKGASATILAAGISKPSEADRAQSVETLKDPALSAVQDESIASFEPVTEYEVHKVLRDLLGNTPYRELRKLEDSSGLYLLEEEVRESDGRKEYSFRRGRPEKNELPGLRIDMTIYDEAGMPVGGHSVAKKIGGRWNLTP